MDLSLQQEDRDGCTVMHVAGEVDLYSGPQLRERLLALIEEGRREFVVDIDGVDFLDSTGLGVLVGVHKRVRAAGGDLRLVCTRPQILKVMEITGLTAVFTIVDSVDAAAPS